MDCEYKNECRQERRTHLERREKDAEFKGAIKKGLIDLEATAERIETNFIKQIGDMWAEVNSMKRVLYPAIGVLGLLQLLVLALLAKFYW